LKQNTEDSLQKFQTDHLQSGEEKKEERFPALQTYEEISLYQIKDG
jgi:hypothetical protein